MGGSSPSILLFFGLAIATLLLVALVGGFVAVQMNPKLLSQLAKLLPRSDSDADRQVDRMGPDGPGGDTASLGEADQLKRVQREHTEARTKQLQADAARESEAEKLARKAVEDARLAAGQKQREEPEKAKREKAQRDIAERQAAAFAALSNLDRITLDDLPLAGDLVDGALTAITICTFDADALFDLSFDLAVPMDPLSEGESFVAAIEPARDQPLTWNLFSNPSREFDKNAPPIPFATIAVKDGKLVLTPASKTSLANQRFSHLRRSVLLVKARNPEKPNEPTGIVKAIQLVRPVSIPSFAVSLLNSSTTIKLKPPLGIKADHGAHNPESFPGTAQVEYEVTYGFTLNSTPKPEVYRGTASAAEPPSFLPLLQCPPTPHSPPDPPTLFGLRVAFAQGLSQVTVTPTIRGPAERSFDLDVIGQLVRKSDVDFKKQLNALKGQREALIKRFDVPVDQVVEQKLEGFLTQYSTEIDAFLAPVQYERWVADCRAIFKEAATVLKTGALQKMQPLKDGWQQQFVAPLKGWAADRATQQHEQLSKMRQYFAPLKTPARVTVRSITTKAVDQDKREYTVILLHGDSKEEPPSDAQDAEPPPSL